MAQQPINVLREPIPLEQLCDELAKLQKTLRWMLNGNIDFENIRAKSISADRMDVTELSAITANLGHITAGLIEAVQIFGSYIATSTGYPRAEMSSTNDLFGAYATATKFINIKSNDAGDPLLYFDNGANLVRIALMSDTFFTGIFGKGSFSSTGDMTLESTGGNVILKPPGINRVTVPSWTSLYANNPGQTMQAALNAKANSFSGVTGTVYVATTSGGPATTPISFTNGIRVS